MMTAKPPLAAFATHVRGHMHRRRVTFRAAAFSNASASSNADGLITVRLVSINDVYDLSNLPRLATLIRSLGSKEYTKIGDANGEAIRPSAVTLNGDFLYPSALSSIDNGRGHVAALRASGVTHVCLGNHEADLPLNVLKERLAELGQRGRIAVLNSNVRGLGRYSRELDIVTSNCGRAKVGLLGFMSDESGMFRDGTFKGLQIDDVKTKYQNMVQKMGNVDCFVPLTHQSLDADIELAHWIAKLQSAIKGEQRSSGVILGGHEHAKILTTKSNVQIVKSGMNSERAAIVDLQFDPTTGELENTHVHFEELDEKYQPCPIVESVVNKHLSALDELQDFPLFDKSSMLSEHFVDPSTGNDLPLSSKYTRYEQTTVGALFCTAIRSELETDYCIMNGAPIKDNRNYPDGTMSYEELKSELPFPLKMTVVEMTRKQLRDAIDFSRSNVEEGKSSAVMDDGRVERRGYMQVDFDCWREGLFDKLADDEVVTVALPRNLLKGFCKIRPLMDLNEELKSKNALPDEDDYIKAVDLIVRYCCKNRWAAIAKAISFEELDENSDGSLDREEIRKAIKLVLGEEPSEELVDGMISAVDIDGNGIIDGNEFKKLLSKLKEQS